ncbi:MAG: carboxymuconolactone decarboxylase family protein [Sphingomonadales bacterium]|nr:carboxymuconolactone decarboxylase family protein [Sphingomonadales bacterium]
MTERTMWRVPMLPREEWTDEAREVMAFWGEPNAWEEGSKTNIQNVVANHPKFGMAFSVWGKHFLTTNSLPMRQYELIILRVGWKLQSQYEWHNHVGYALQYGVTLEEIEACKTGAADPVWDDKPLDRLTLAAVDELMTSNDLSDETWNALAQHFDRRQMMDFVFVIGHYVMLGWGINAMRMPLETHTDPIGWDLKTASGKTPGVTFKPGEVEDWADKRGYS